VLVLCYTHPPRTTNEIYAAVTPTFNVTLLHDDVSADRTMTKSYTNNGTSIVKS